MSMTPAALTRASAVAAVAAGVVFVGVQINHPPLDVTTIATTEVVIRNSLKVLMAVLALAGITGMYVSRIRRNGLLGLIGYVVLATGYLAILCTSYLAAFVLPSIAGSDPSYVSSVLTAAAGGPISSNIGALGTAIQVQNLTYLAGGVLFGVALVRAGVLVRWGAVLLAVGGLVTIALSMLPDMFHRLLAFPNGIAMIVLGYSLWRTATMTTLDPSETPRTPAAVV